MDIVGTNLPVYYARLAWKVSWWNRLTSPGRRRCGWTPVTATSRTLACEFAPSLPTG